MLLRNYDIVKMRLRFGVVFGDYVIRFEFSQDFITSCLFFVCYNFQSLLARHGLVSVDGTSYQYFRLVLREGLLIVVLVFVSTYLIDS